MGLPLLAVTGASISLNAAGQCISQGAREARVSCCFGIMLSMPSLWLLPPSSLLQGLVCVGHDPYYQAGLWPPCWSRDASATLIACRGLAAGQGEAFWLQPPWRTIARAKPWRMEPGGHVQWVSLYWRGVGKAGPPR